MFLVWTNRAQQRRAETEEETNVVNKTDRQAETDLDIQR